MSVPLIAELKRRRVFRALVGYAIVAFAVLQVIEPVMHGLRLPDWTLSFVLVALAIGFPVVLAFAWVFDVSAGGIERTLPLRPAGLGRLPLALAVGAVAPTQARGARRTRSRSSIRSRPRRRSTSACGPGSSRWLATPPARGG